MTGTDAGAEELTEQYLATIEPGLQFVPTDREITEFIERPYASSPELLAEWRAINAQAPKS
ncbi:hypothetical protein N825_23255 [Skermanella stibiiresistens SB22]|uniref:Uncharacterized protein n=1 Tax=Skermanella stibiiresistens SB22 TaxID=1385369 RepID=W9GSN4_9PROT|nr:hypothetical protein [Skermanella stibiiresistens]EWY36905.1 hypothetical protein N825_23255 [Skermanella stibiiresistens SB22]